MIVSGTIRSTWCLGRQRLEFHLRRSTILKATRALAAAHERLIQSIMASDRLLGRPAAHYSPTRTRAVYGAELVEQTDKRSDARYSSIFTVRNWPALFTMRDCGRTHRAVPRGAVGKRSGRTRLRQLACADICEGVWNAGETWSASSAWSRSARVCISSGHTTLSESCFHTQVAPSPSMNSLIRGKAAFGHNAAQSLSCMAWPEVFRGREIFLRPSILDWRTAHHTQVRPRRVPIRIRHPMRGWTNSSRSPGATVGRSGSRVTCAHASDESLRGEWTETGALLREFSHEIPRDVVSRGFGAHRGSEPAAGAQCKSNLGAMLDARVAASAASIFPAHSVCEARPGRFWWRKTRATPTASGGDAAQRARAMCNMWGRNRHESLNSLPRLLRRITISGTYTRKTRGTP